jgi:4-amino-4-deoxy-L-arabinose transferase-like glycosyltransferase
VEPWWFFLPLLLLGVFPWVTSFVGACRRGWLDAGSPAAQFKPRKFLVIFCAVTLLFFSASGSKLAPYLLPMFPPLAALVGAYGAEQKAFLSRVARISAALMALFCVALLIYSARRNSFVPDEALAWSIAAVAASLVAVVATWKHSPGTVAPAFATAATGALAWQLFLMAFAAVPPAHSARDLVAAAQPYVRPQTTLYSVGQYRETLSPYLQRTLTLVSFEGELQFGLHAEPGKQMATPADFVARWNSSTDAVAFFDPGVWDQYRRNGLPGRVIAADHATVAVSRL